MKLEERISAFVALGKKIKELSPDTLEELQWSAKNGNNWFTEESVTRALQGISHMLDAEKVTKWVDSYPLAEGSSGICVGVLMAGNIPAVGFHDLMCILLAGHVASIKLSSSDTVLMKWLISELIRIDARFEGLIEIQEMLKGKDAYIATGSDNSARYFNYYFGKYPHIIRKNRTSVGILTGDETVSDYLNLGLDIFQYFGLGCRNVSKIYLKDPAQLQDFLGAIEVYNTVASHHKYSNNYDYNKSIFLVNRDNHLDNGFLILKESNLLVSPIAVLFYEYYRDEAHLTGLIQESSSKIQCIVSKNGAFQGSIPFGNAQQPELADYADGVDTMSFLAALG